MVSRSRGLDRNLDNNSQPLKDSSLRIKLLLISMFLVCASTMAGCGKVPTKLDVIAVDVTDATSYQEYQEDIERLLLSFSETNGSKIDRTVVVKGLTADPLQDAGTSYTYRFPVYRPSQQTADSYKRMIKKDIAKATSDLEKLVVRYGSSDVRKRVIDGVSATSQLIAAMRASSSYDSTELLVFSSMVERSAYEQKGVSVFYDFCSEGTGLNRKVNTDLCKDCKFSKAILLEEKTKGRLVDMQGVKVFIYGGSSCNVKDSRDYVNIREFWLAYFKALGADASPERYLPSMVDVP